MNKYEIMFIVRPDMEEAEIKNTAEEVKKVLTEKNATIVEEKANFEAWGPFGDLEIMYDWSGKTADFTPDLKDADYVAQLKAAMESRLNAVKDFAVNCMVDVIFSAPWL